ncbi:MAG: flavin reductase family protein, partial [Actinoallomurus sp.]
MPEERPDLRAMMGRFATGVTVVAARHGPLLAGMTANAIASISLDPPLLMASINRRSETHVAIVGSHSFAVSVLGVGQ